MANYNQYNPSGKVSTLQAKNVPNFYPAGRAQRTLDKKHWIVITNFKTEHQSNSNKYIKLETAEYDHMGRLEMGISERPVQRD